jgi:hypothetical protein
MSGGQTSGLRLMIYDRTCVGKHAPVGLSTAWGAGSMLYRGLGRLDGTFGATSWDEALGWLANVEPSRPIAEIQYWGHGQWGRVLVDRDALDARALAPGHRLAARIDAVRERLAPEGDSLFWLRTCEAFGASAGLDFATRLADRFGARVAGHTFIIGAIQSGLHGLRPGHTPDWSAAEGIKEGTPDRPLRAHGSGVRKPRTITCLAGEVPGDWFA